MTFYSNKIKSHKYLLQTGHLLPLYKWAKWCVEKGLAQNQRDTQEVARHMWTQVRLKWILSCVSLEACTTSVDRQSKGRKSIKVEQKRMAGGKAQCFVFLKQGSFLFASLLSSAFYLGSQLSQVCVCGNWQIPTKMTDKDTGFMMILEVVTAFFTSD